MSDRTNGFGLIRVATGLLAFLAAYLAYAVSAPDVEAAHARLDDAELRLRADDALFSERTSLAAADKTLTTRYRASLTSNTEAAFVRDLAADARRHGVTILSTSFTLEPRSLQPEHFGTLPNVAISPAADAEIATHFTTTRVLVQMRGTYRSLLGTISEISFGSQIVRVEEPSLRRDGDAVVATLPAALLRPIDPSQAVASPAVQP